MTEEIDAIMFDLGGTLIDLRPPRHEMFASVLSRLGAAVDPAKVAKAMAKADRIFDREMALLDGHDEGVFWTRFDAFILDELKLKLDIDAVASGVSAAFDEVIPKVDSWVLFPESRPILEGLSRRDFKLGVVSNATDLARKVVDKLGLSEFLDVLVISDEVGIRKPARGIFRLALDRAGTEPNRSVFVGDKPALDVLPAVEMGMHGVLVDRHDAFPDCPCLRVRDLNFFKRFF